VVDDEHDRPPEEVLESRGGDKQLAAEAVHLSIVARRRRGTRGRRAAAAMTRARDIGDPRAGRHRCRQRRTYQPIPTPIARTSPSPTGIAR
jgi:hypothetical protein